LVVVVVVGMGVWLSLRFGTLGGSAWWGAACLALGVGTVWLVERKVPPLAVLYGAAVLATVAGALW
jgi:hypothetical protein